MLRLKEFEMPLPLGSMGCLALLEGAQPMLMKRCVAPTVDRRTIVLAGEYCKLLASLVLLGGDVPKTVREICYNWRGVVRRAGLPAVLFALQNFLLQVAYPRLDSLVFSVVGQTKILFVALAIDFPKEVFPTPGGPTKHKIGPFIF